MLDKEIRQLDPEDAKRLLEGCWTKAWYGQLLHFFTSHWITLCGKEMPSHRPDGWATMAAKTCCMSCYRKHLLLEQRKEGHVSDRAGLREEHR